MESKPEDDQPEWGKKLSRYFPIPQRVILAIMAFLSVLNNYTLRICLSVTITRLVIERPYRNESSSSAVCPMKEEDEFDQEANGPGGEYDWSQSFQGYILGAFYIGYIIGHLPAALLSEKFGAKWVLATGIGISTILTLITPICIQEMGPWALFVLRIIIGYGAGSSYPCCSALLAHWVPIHERSLLGAFIMGGGQIGAFFGNSISGLILKYSTWPMVFYVFGIGGALWVFFFVILCYSDPRSHPYIGEKEKQYLMEHMGRLGREHNLPPTPWGPIFKSVPVWALILAQIAHDWGFYVMISDLPKFMNDVMQFSIAKNGVYSSVPFLAMWIFSLITGWIADIIIAKDKKYATAVRRIMTFIAAAPAGVFMVLAAYSGCNNLLIVMHFTICMMFMGSYYAGIKLSANDMSPNYSATVMAIVNGIGAIAGIFVPYSVGWMTPNTTMQEWRVVFWLAFIILTVVTIPFCFWGTAEIQEWNEPKKE